jgi:microcin C transport system ATP-binding protein
VTALSIPGLLPYPRAFHPRGRIRLEGQDLLGRPARELRQLRGRRIGMVFQEPLTSLNPLHRIGRQIEEAVRQHRPVSAQAARARAQELLELVRLDDARSRLDAYPHELSGGQRQRVVIAIAIANEPDLLIADEPTTALDVTIQAQILALLRDLQRRLGMAILLITHDLAVVRHMAERVAVMKDGRIVEQGPTERVFSRPQDAYTRVLLEAEPRGPPVPVPPGSQEVIRAEGLGVTFRLGGRWLGGRGHELRAVDDVSLSVTAGETLGIVGESGSGKSTLGLALLRLQAASGRVVHRGRDLAGLGRHQLRAVRARLQLVFQDPFGSLSPRLSVEQIIAEGLEVHAPRLGESQRRDRVAATMRKVGLDPALMHRFPHEFSGGQRQRIAIARALILEPELIVLDEPTSALDVSIQAQIVELLRDLQRELRLAYVFISHDLRVVRALAHRVIVMRRGRIVEQGPAARVLTAPADDYTRELLQAALLAPPRPVEGAAPPA